VGRWAAEIDHTGGSSRCLPRPDFRSPVERFQRSPWPQSRLSHAPDAPLRAAQIFFATPKPQTPRTLPRLVFPHEPSSRPAHPRHFCWGVADGGPGVPRRQSSCPRPGVSSRYNPRPPRPSGVKPVWENLPTLSAGAVDAAIGAIAGGLIGFLAALRVAKKTIRHQWRLEEVRREQERRYDAYRDALTLIYPVRRWMRRGPFTKVGRGFGMQGPDRDCADRRRAPSGTLWRVAHCI
jgi:hypothetical protein